jgi:hypothetical protein
MAKNRNYESNKWTISDSERARIRERWGDLIDRLGY